MTTTCDAARKAIESRQLRGWTGLPAGCAPAALLGVPLDTTWGQRRLGSGHGPVQSRLLELEGYYRPMASVRDGAVVMFDAMNPDLDGGWAALAADLGAPEATHDWVYGTVPMAGGERIYAKRGITVYINRDGDDILHVALYAPTTPDAYARDLRPDLQKKPLRK
jgi:hypothetical protein